VTEDHIRTPEELRAHTTELFTLVEKGELVVRIGGHDPLAEAAEPTPTSSHARPRASCR
jgi:NADPH:quinone reductase